MRLKMTLLLLAVLTLTACGGATAPAGESPVSPQQPAAATPAPAPAPAPAAAPTAAEATVTGKVSVHVGAVKLQGGGKERTYLEGTGVLAGATVIFFTGEKVLGQARTEANGWTQPVTVTAPLDQRVALLYDAYKAAGKAEDLPGSVSALVTLEGYRPTLLTNLGVPAGKSAGYSANLFKLGDPVQTDGVDMAPDGPMTQAQALAWDNRGSHLGRDLVQTILRQAGSIPAQP